VSEAAARPAMSNKKQRMVGESIQYSVLSAQARRSSRRSMAKFHRLKTEFSRGATYVDVCARTKLVKTNAA
jgi:hypothetical protein